MHGTFLLAAVPLTLGFIPTINFGRAPLYHPTRASRDAAAEDSGAGGYSRIDAVAAQTDGPEAAEDTTEDTTEDADAKILRELEDEVTRLDAARRSQARC